MDIKNAVICWTPNQDWWDDHPLKGQVKVFDRSRSNAGNHGFASNAGACDLEWLQADEMTRVALMFIHFHTLVVKDRIDPQAAHQAFLQIDEYRRRISLEISGAEEG